MKINYYDNMTDEMKSLAELTLNKEILEKEYEYCNNMYEKTKKASKLSLPHIAENGNDVLQGAKKEMSYIAEYWKIRRDLANDMLA